MLLILSWVLIGRVLILIIVETAGGGSLGKLLGTVSDPSALYPHWFVAVAMDPGVFKRLYSAEDQPIAHVPTT